MLKSVTKRQIVRASAPSREDQHHGCFYEGCYTLEPTLVEDAWAKLSEDTFALEIATYPRLFHRAFLSEMRKRTKHA